MPSVESAVLSMPCPVDGCTAEIPMRADVEHRAGEPCVQEAQR